MVSMPGTCLGTMAITLEEVHIIAYRHAKDAKDPDAQRAGFH